MTIDCTYKLRGMGSNHTVHQLCASHAYRLLRKKGGVLIQLLLTADQTYELRDTGPT
jgi:hypothetical protein